MTAIASGTTGRFSIFQLMLLALSMLVLIALAIDALVSLPKEISKLLQMLDTAACALFFTDFLVRFYRAQSKLAFMKWGWIDLLASIPTVDAFRVGRLVRVFRILRLLRGVRVAHRIIALLMQNKLKTAAASVPLTTILLVIFSSIGALLVEQGPQATIQTAEDAIWWSVTTITTVGYGDKYPTTTEGRIVAVILMLSGVGLFGTLSGLVAAVFLGSNTEEAIELRKLETSVQALHERIEHLLDKRGPPRGGAITPTQDLTHHR